MRTLTYAGAIAVAASASLLVAPSASATGAPGDNGDVKIHKSSTSEDLRRNEPHVCSFYLDAFDFDGVQKVEWHIEAWAPTAKVKGETVKTGSLTLDSAGHGRTADMTLPDGHYKLFWNFNGEHGKAKHKVFWTKCSSTGGTGGGTPSGSPSVSASASTSPSASASTSASASPSASSSSSAVASGSTAPSASASAGGGLAETGSSAPLGLLGTVAAALVAAGGGLVVWRRKSSAARQH
ncbi:hypothetical protein [Streptomyces beihaiensis]|uniref:LPXTG cell wall anchor domain-containing protein n=1 Tax=Streptomyces beihaiensis TaxID=2984495 RepID=A0ABT3TUG0_9ACTN|nr:hypothetical protein [Streptomyces beihaiensis]MCX3060659.1 hypothetical protein [Streptomyces beihaiensis]